MRRTRTQNCGLNRTLARRQISATSHFVLHQIHRLCIPSDAAGPFDPSISGKYQPGKAFRHESKVSAVCHVDFPAEFRLPQRKNPDDRASHCDFASARIDAIPRSFGLPAESSPVGVFSVRAERTGWSAAVQERRHRRRCACTTPMRLRLPLSLCSFDVGDNQKLEPCIDGEVPRGVSHYRKAQGFLEDVISSPPKALRILRSDQPAGDYQCTAAAEPESA